MGKAAHATLAPKSEMVIVSVRATRVFSYTSYGNLLVSVKPEDGLRRHCGVGNGQSKSITQSKGHTPCLRFRYLSLTCLDSGIA